MKKWLKSLFKANSLNEIEEEFEEKPVEAKVYQSHSVDKNKSERPNFRFPLDLDEDVPNMNEQTIVEPAFQQQKKYDFWENPPQTTNRINREENQHASNQRNNLVNHNFETNNQTRQFVTNHVSNHVSNRYEEKPVEVKIEKEVEKEEKVDIVFRPKRKTPFKPSEYISPIYGYQKPSVKEINEVNQTTSIQNQDLENEYSSLEMSPNKEIESMSKDETIVSIPVQDNVGVNELSQENVETLSENVYSNQSEPDQIESITDELNHLPNHEIRNESDHKEENTEEIKENLDNVQYESIEDEVENNDETLPLKNESKTEYVDETQHHEVKIDEESEIKNIPRITEVTNTNERSEEEELITKIEENESVIAEDNLNQNESMHSEQVQANKVEESNESNQHSFTESSEQEIIEEATNKDERPEQSAPEKREKKRHFPFNVMMLRSDVEASRKANIMRQLRELQNESAATLEKVSEEANTTEIEETTVETNSLENNQVIDHSTSIEIEEVAEETNPTENGQVTDNTTSIETGQVAEEINPTENDQVADHTNQIESEQDAKETNSIVTKPSEQSELKSFDEYTVESTEMKAIVVENHQSHYDNSKLQVDLEPENNIKSNLEVTNSEVGKIEEHKEIVDELPVMPPVLYELPELDLLNEPPVEQFNDGDWVEGQKELLQETLHNFNVGAKVIAATQGPTVTRFEVQPDPGVKVNKITNLQDDIKLSLAARDIRIEAPIPGRSAIGIEVPNRESKPVYLRELVSEEKFLQSESPLTVALGLDIGGEPVYADIAKMPHGLIAGATGSGKSVCINSILVSILYKAKPHEVKLILIDPKMVELAPYNHIPHLISPVITDARAATAALKWACDEMDRRYDLFAHAGARDIKRFNDLAKKKGAYNDALPYLVIIIDELADLMMVSPGDVETYICRIAQKARACGIHLLVATQRPSVDVITGIIKSNIPTRIAFTVSSQVDSRTIIDIGGAEKLLGRGDMLFLDNGKSQAVRLQGVYVSDDEIEHVVEIVKDQQKPNYLFNQEELVAKADAQDVDDELFKEAVEFVIDQKGASVSMLQRRFRIGYNRAARLVDLMFDHGIVSNQNGSKPRDVLVTLEEFRSED
ncbi:DNA translocase FtsK [Gottfriedia luciferensis]|uniref:DNA translocase FtsK n=1 Tax=Gottfriedia luciferensis TaxID=178774 RepID=UPI000B43834B|nr:DNA translocase FtsK [Gottfriedia luciferensis]